ncbi:MAG TPA: sigma-70 family RNA polymerase sigma factor [Acidimicrobiia bacterium]|nr:sigma-70 family RNA polymerase sigma factor [Acidimicrobiia bacterium]
MTTLRDATQLRQRDFPDFYRVHHQSVFRALAATTGDPELAQEATDEAMTRAYQRWSTVADYDNAPGWVYRVGLNWARSRLRKQRREHLREIPPDQPHHQPLPDPDVEAALRSLPIEERSLVVLRHLMDWSYDEIAAALGIPVGTAKSRLHRVMNELRSKLEERR